MRRDLTGIASESGGVILFNDVEDRGNGVYYNVARLAGPRGLIGDPYRKVHLVPFGEYVPLPKIFFFVRQVSTEIGAFSAAERPVPLAADTLSVGVGICYEILYPSLAREEAAQGANQHFLYANLTAAQSKQDVLDSIAESFLFPTHFGKNLDALYDCMTDIVHKAGAQPGFVVHRCIAHRSHRSGTRGSIIHLALRG